MPRKNRNATKGFQAGSLPRKVVAGFNVRLPSVKALNREPQSEAAGVPEPQATSPALTTPSQPSS